MADIPEQIADLLRQGRREDAVKLFSESTGRNLADSNAEIDRILATLTPEGRAAQAEADVLPEKVLHLARQGKKLDAIRILREERGLGLKEAKDRVEAIEGVRSGGCMGSPLLVAGSGALLALAVG